MDVPRSRRRRRRPKKPKKLPEEDEVQYEDLEQYLRSNVHMDSYTHYLSDCCNPEHSHGGIDTCDHPDEETFTNPKIKRYITGYHIYADHLMTRMVMRCLNDGVKVNWEFVRHFLTHNYPMVWYDSAEDMFSATYREMMMQQLRNSLIELKLRLTTPMLNHRDNFEAYFLN